MQRIKKILNVNLDRNNNNNAATVALVKELAPFTKNALYRLYFSEVYDFANADSYGINIGCLLYTSPSPRDQRGSRMPSSA